ncbi:potassium channel family protein [Lunatibacter salilacus]|uniref:potassium channel family protein n=1 Tax=Lunatibacter salilacus TaxID=2483804 RepID=UPI00131D2C9E|nr:potassium channel family protein [Lunatibacter salilacus]
MRAYIKKFKNYWESDASFISLLVMLVITVFVLPIMIDSERENTLFLNFMFIGLFFIGTFSSRERTITIASITMLVVHLGLRLIRFSDSPYEYYLMERVVIVINLLLFIFINIRLLFRDYQVNAHRIIGAINVYLSVAMAGAFGFEIIHLILGGSIEGNIELLGGDQDYGNYIYYSLTNLSTVGYGDLYAVNIQAKMLSVFLSVVGILYPAVIIAKLISFKAP